MSQIQHGVLIVFATLMFQACAQQKFSSAEDQVKQDVPLPPKPIPQKDQPICELNPVNFDLRLSITDLVLKDKKGFEFGFKYAGGSIPVGLKAKFKATEGVMKSVTNLYAPLNAKIAAISSQTGEGSFKNKNNAFLIDISFFSIGFDRSDLADLRKTASDSVLQSVSKAYAASQKMGYRWFTKITQKKDGKLIIPVGSAAGLRTGDLFSIHSTKYYWNDKLAPPCNDNLEMVDASLAPTAILKIENIYFHGASASLVEGDYAQVQTGDYVFPKTLLKNTSQEIRKLKTPVRILSIDSQALQSTEGNKLDVVPYLDKTMNALLQNSDLQFYLMNWNWNREE